MPFKQGVRGSNPRWSTKAKSPETYCYQWFPGFFGCKKQGTRVRLKYAKLGQIEHIWTNKVANLVAHLVANLCKKDPAS